MPERPPAVKRISEVEDDAMGEEYKQLRIQDEAAMPAISSVGEIEDKTADMNEDDRRRLAAARFLIDITEVHSPVHVAAVAAGKQARLVAVRAAPPPPPLHRHHRCCCSLLVAVAVLSNNKVTNETKGRTCTCG